MDCILDYVIDLLLMGFPGGSDGKEFACKAGDLGSIRGLGRYSGVGNGNPLQYSCLENFMDREAWQATIEGVAKSQTQLSTHVSKTSHWVPRLDTLSGCVCECVVNRRD